MQTQSLTQLDDDKQPIQNGLQKAEDHPRQIEELNHKIHDLQQKIDDLERGLFDKDVELQAVTDEFERAYSEAEEARKALERANNVKSAFLASVSHELRTPLNAIINFTKFLSAEKMGPVNERQADLLSKVESSGVHLLNLINDVLDITKIESNSMKLLVESSVNIVEQIRRVVILSEGLLNGKPVEIKTVLEPDLPTIVGDKQRIFQILINIMSNACKFTDEGSITILAKSDDENIYVHITDTGPGIPEDDFSLVFETFRQTQTGLRSASGTGLGMPISKRLAQAHGGDILLESTLDVGSTFIVQLPIKSNMLVPNFD